MIGVSPNLNPDMAALAHQNWQELASSERKAALQKRIEALPDQQLSQLPPSDRFIAWYVRRDPEAWYDYTFDSSGLWKGIHLNMPLFDYLLGVVFRDIDITSGLEKFNKPVFLALGRYDFIVPPPRVWDSIKSKFKNLTVQIFEKSGHSPQYEEPSLFDQSLLKWLATKKIIVTPYNPEWPAIFNRETVKIQEALGANCMALHHIGSTSVPGLSAKPIIDIIGVVKDPEKVIQPLTNLGFQYKGEYNIPMRLYFNRSDSVNLHVYEEGHPEIELNLLFRDYLKEHEETRNAYALLKNTLLQEKSSYEKKHSLFTGYNLRKDAFIRDILKAANFNLIRFMKCTHYAEWDAAKRLRNQYFFDPLSIKDPYTWTFDHKEHAHLILYQGMDIVGYAHIQLWPNKRAALRIIVIDEPYRNKGLGSQFLLSCEQWLKRQGIRSLHDEARPDALNFYRKNGYIEMPFNDPSGEPPSMHDLAMGKVL